MRYVLMLICLGGAMMAQAGSGKPLFDARNMPLVDGRPRLLLGLYENPAEDAKLKEAVEAGFNLIYCPPDLKALDRVQALGARAWINLGGNLDLSQDAGKRKAALLETVNRFKGHPALLIWEGPDEALWNAWYGVDNYFETSEHPAMREAAKGRPELERLLAEIRDLKSRALWKEMEAARSRFWQLSGKVHPRPDLRFDAMEESARKTGEGLTAGIRAVKEADPGHIVWLNHAPRNSLKSLKFYNRATDMAGCDIYPIPYNLLNGHSDLENTRPGSVGAYTDRMRAAAPGKACAMVLQGFGWRDLAEPDEHSDELSVGRRPTFAESRFMAYDALMHGANVILYWGTAYIKPEEPAEAGGNRPQLWNDSLRLARELRAMEPVLLAPPVAPAPAMKVEESPGSNDGKGLRLALKQVGEDYALVLLNDGIEGLAFTVRNLPATLEGKTLYRLGTDETRTVSGRSFRDGIRGSEVHIYTTSRRFEAERSGE
ncbi:MAG: hypothetical protein IT210_03110 [Armatimonadetes bacterium]|nr:hypothetical protein [Armatimonadota bacterium]